MHQAGTIAAGTAVALFLGLPGSSRAFSPPLSHNKLRQPQRERLQKLDASKSPSFKPSWEPPRRNSAATRPAPATAPPESSWSSVDAPAQSVPQAADYDRRGSRPASFSKTAWQPSPTNKDAASASNVKAPGASTPVTIEAVKPPSNAASSGASAAGEPTTATTAAAAAVTGTDDNSSSTSRTRQQQPTPATERQASPLPVVEDVTPPPTMSVIAPASPFMDEAMPEPASGKAAMDVGLTLRRAKEALSPFRKRIQDNIAEGNVGERGEEWVLAQGAILLFIALGGIPIVGGLVMTLAGPGLALGGAAVSAAGLSGLGQNLSPWPTPVMENELKTDGIFGVMRHPIYTGLVMFCLGFGVITVSPSRMLLAALLAVFLDKKAEKEEKLLVGLHGEAYEEYQATVAKFVPWLY